MGLITSLVRGEISPHSPMYFRPFIGVNNAIHRTTRVPSCWFHVELNYTNYTLFLLASAWILLALIVDACGVGFVELIGLTQCRLGDEVCGCSLKSVTTK